MHEPLSASEGRSEPPHGVTSAFALLEATAIRKHYGGARALDGAHLRVSRLGVVHTLLGENGSGKSTLLGVISGQVRPDAGQLLLGGEPVSFSAPLDALHHGVAMVAQETAVVSTLSVAENVLLGRLVRTRLGVDWPASHRRAAEVLGALGLDYNTHWMVGRLRADQRQLVEIARAISTDARVLILDEPTSSLTDDEVSGLFSAIAELKAQGVAILFVSHRISEVMEISDEITVLRDGQTVAEGVRADFDPDSLVYAMVGEIENAPASQSATPVPSAGQPVLSVTGLCSGREVDEVDLELWPGEIVGIAGLVGAGRTELLETLFGLRPISAGAIEVDGVAYRPASVRAAIARGLGFVPGDRQALGLVRSMSARTNLTMVETADRFRLSAPRLAMENAVYERGAQAMRLRARPERPVGQLSGGNQQKVVLAKWLVLGPKALLLEEPTRGVDVAAKAEIYRHLRAAAGEGVAMLVSSSESPELLEICSRIIVMFRGHVVACLPRMQASEAALARLAGGHQ